MSTAQLGFANKGWQSTLLGLFSPCVRNLDMHPFSPEEEKEIQSNMIKKDVEECMLFFCNY